MIKVQFDTNVEFRTPRVDAEKRAQLGEIELARPWPIFIEKIDAGAQSPFVFYFVNITKLYASVVI